MEYIALKDICKINMGQSPDSSSYNYIQDGIPFFQGNADFGDKYPVNRVWCNNPVKIACKDDILISVRAPIGALNYATESCCIGRGLAALTPDTQKVSTEYIYWFLKGKTEELNNKGTGSTFKAISKKVLEDIMVAYVDLETQYKRAKNLEKIYSIIQMRKQELNLLDELIKARFIEMFGDPSNPMGWNVVNVDSIADVQVGVVIKPSQYYTDKDSGTPAFRSLNIGSMCIRNNDWVYFTDEGHKKNSKSIIKENDLLIVRSGAPGTACVVTKEYEGYNAIDVIIAHPYTEKVNPYYLCAYTNFPHGKLQIDEGTGGAAQQHFNVGKYNKLKVMLPPISMQNKYFDFLKQVDKSKSVIKKSLEETQTLFDSLMQKYFG